MRAILVALVAVVGMGACGSEPLDSTGSEAVVASPSPLVDGLPDGAACDADSQCEGGICAALKGLRFCSHVCAVAADCSAVDCVAVDSGNLVCEPPATIKRKG